MRKKILFISAIIIIITIVLFVISKPISNKLANQRLERGITYYSDEEYSMAALKFEKAIKLNKKLVEAYVNLAKTYLQLSKDDDAFNIAGNLLEIEPDNSEAYAICGQVKINKEDYPQAIDFFDKAIVLDTNIASAYYYRGVAKANLGDLTAALSDYKIAQKKDAENAWYYESSVLIYTKLEDYSSVIKDYNKILELDKSNVEAFYQRGYFKLNINDFNGAISDFNSAIKINNKLGKAFYYRGLAKAKSRMYKEAINDFKESTRLKYKEHEAFFNEGLAWLQLKSLKEAKTALNSCLKINPSGIKSNDALLNSGVIELMNGNYNSAIKYFDKLITETDVNANALFNRAICLGELKRNKEALDDLNKCIELGLKTAEVYFARGVQNIATHSYEKGCNDLKIAANNGHLEARRIMKMYCN